MSQDVTVQHNLESVEALRHRPMLPGIQGTSWPARSTHRPSPRLPITESERVPGGNIAPAAPAEYARFAEPEFRRAQGCITATHPWGPSLSTERAVLTR